MVVLLFCGRRTRTGGGENYQWQFEEVMLGRSGGLCPIAEQKCQVLSAITIDKFVQQIYKFIIIRMAIKQDNKKGKSIPAHQKAGQSYFAYYRTTTWRHDLVFGFLLAIIGCVVYWNVSMYYGLIFAIVGVVSCITALVRYKMGWKERGQYWEDKSVEKS